MNLHYTATKTIVHGYMVGALALSFNHIVDLFGMLGATGHQTYLAPIFIDGLMLLGLLGRSQRMAPSTRRTGLRLQITAGMASLVCNIAAGHTAGDRLIGVMVVVGYVVSEWYGAKLRPTRKGTQTAPRKPAAPKATDRSAASRKAAVTRKANAAAKVAEARAVAAMN
jgi:hypothetical protein